MPLNSNYLLSDEVLAPDQSISSAGGRYTLVYQGDGNLVLYKNYPNRRFRPLWASNTGGIPGSCIMQGDGNLVIYDGDGQSVWASDTGTPGSRLIVQDDGNVVIYQPDNVLLWATDTGGQQVAPTGPAPQGDDIQPGEVLAPGQSISSAGGRYTFVCEFFGNLVLYKNYPNRRTRPLWRRNNIYRSGGARGGGGRVIRRIPGSCIMQGDGNLVLYDGDGRSVWASNTGTPGSRLIVQDDGNVVIYQPDNVPVWDTDTGGQQIAPTGSAPQGDDIQPGEVLAPDQAISSASGRYTLVYQGDGNLVLYKNYPNRRFRPLWASNTGGIPGSCIIQGDGNLVIYDGDGQSVWASDTGIPGSRLIVQDDGNVVVYQPDNVPVWVAP